MLLGAQLSVRFQSQTILKGGTNMRALIFVTCAILFFPSSPRSAIVGDIDSNGQIDLSEAIYALQVASGLYPDVSTSCLLR